MPVAYKSMLDLCRQRIEDWILDRAVGLDGACAHGQ
jgi:hypothetical protein